MGAPALDPETEGGARDSKPTLEPIVLAREPIAGPAEWARYWRA